MVTIARVVGAHGLRGELKLALESDVVARFAPPLTVLVDSSPERELTLTAFRLHGRWGLAAFAGMEDRSAAEALIGRSLMVRDEDRWPLPEGRYYADDLVGMAAVGVGGADLGRVQGVVPGLAHDLLQLSSGPLVPMVRAWVAIDPETRRVTVLMPLESVVDDAH